VSMSPALLDTIDIDIDAPEMSPQDLTPAAECASAATERHARIAQAAFLIAQARGFEPGSELDDWLEAERQMDQAGTVLSD